MATWAELEHAEPGLDAFGRERFEGRVVFHATLMADGSPRVHPVSPWFASGLLLVSFRSKSPKVARPYAASYALASFACSVDEAVATTYPGGGSPVYRRWRP
jgi:hypothetical protein